MKIMARHSSATPREEKSTTNRTSAQRGKESDNNNSTLKAHIIDASLKRRARLLITNSSIPRQTRSLIRYALEIRDPCLAQVVRRVEAGELTIDHLVQEQD
jgi:hypothetical protein